MTSNIYFLLMSCYRYVPLRDILWTACEVDSTGVVARESEDRLAKGSGIFRNRHRHSTKAVDCVSRTGKKRKGTDVPDVPVGEYADIVRAEGGRELKKNTEEADKKKEDKKKANKEKADKKKEDKKKANKEKADEKKEVKNKKKKKKKKEEEEEEKEKKGEDEESEVDEEDIEVSFLFFAFLGCQKMYSTLR